MSDTIQQSECDLPYRQVFDLHAEMWRPATGAQLFDLTWHGDIQAWVYEAGYHEERLAARRAYALQRGLSGVEGRVVRLPDQAWYACIGGEWTRQLVALWRATQRANENEMRELRAHLIDDGTISVAHRCVIWGCTEPRQAICGCCGNYVCKQHLVRDRRCVRCVDHP